MCARSPLFAFICDVSDLCKRTYIVYCITITIIRLRVFVVVCSAKANDLCFLNAHIATRVRLGVNAKNSVEVRCAEHTDIESRAECCLALRE